jgi:hypothetical protein
MGWRFHPRSYGRPRSRRRFIARRVVSPSARAWRTSGMVPILAVLALAGLAALIGNRGAPPLIPTPVPIVAAIQVPTDSPPPTLFLPPSATPSPLPPALVTVAAENARRAALAVAIYATQTTVAQPTATPLPPPTATPIPFASGGLGATLGAWEAHHGAGLWAAGSSRTYAGDTYTLFFGEPDRSAITTDSLITGMLRSWAIDHWPSLTSARATMRALLPTDAHLVRTTTDSSGLLIFDVYQSASLAARYTDPYIWLDSPPGSFVVDYSGTPVILAGVELGTLMADVGDPTSGVNTVPTAGPAPGGGGLVPSGGRSGAVCADGTFSSATGRGACSHHGGVAHWLP